SPWGEWKGTFGTQLETRQFEAVGEESFVPPGDTTNVGLFVIQQRDVGDWGISLGGRVERQRQEPTTPGLGPIDGTAASASLSGIRRLSNDHAFAVNVALAQRLPVAEELYANGPHLASGIFEVGNPYLDKESSHHVDLSFRKTAGKT